MSVRGVMAWLFWLASAVAQAGDLDGRVALVIANARYTGAAQLANAESDGWLIADTLRALGFRVEYRVDLERREMRVALDQFAQTSKLARTALIYYAGHGVQVRGLNYLVPVHRQHAFPASEQDVEATSVSAQEIVDRLGRAPGRTNIIILDACRDNPFSTDYRSIGPTRAAGLAPMEAPAGTLLAYSTAPGRKARDGGAGGHSVYSAALAREMRRPGASIEQTFKAVRASVLRDTLGEQVPWESTSLIGDFSFAAFARDPVGPQASGATAIGAQMAPTVPEVDARLAELRRHAASLDARTALDGLRRQAGAGVADAQLLLGMVLSDLRNGVSAQAEARTWWQAAASRGDAVAQLLLAESLLGQSRPTDLDRARATGLLEQAADAGSARALALLRR